MSDNARIQQIANGVNSEVIAEQTHLFYDVNTGRANVSFQARKYLFVNGVPQSPMGDFDVLPVQISNIASRCLTPEGSVDPVTGADLSKISAAGMMVVLKAAYDVLYNERAIAADPATVPA